MLPPIQYFLLICSSDSVGGDFLPDAVTEKKKVSCKVQWDCSGAGRAPTRGAPFLVCLTAEIVAMAPAARAGATGHEGGREDCPPSPGTAFERDGGGWFPGEDTQEPER